MAMGSWNSNFCVAVFRVFFVSSNRLFRREKIMIALFPGLLSLSMLSLGSASACASPPTLRPATLSPTSIGISFDNKIAYARHHVTVDASFVQAPNATERTRLAAEGCYDLVLFFGDHEGDDELLERPLPDGIGSVCWQRGGHVVIDDTYDESYALSCCEPNNASCVSASSFSLSSGSTDPLPPSFMCPFSCPIPAADLVAPDDVATWDRIIGWSGRIHATSRERHAMWSYLHGDAKREPIEFRFVPERSEFGTANMLMTICVFIPIVTGAITGTTDQIGRASCRERV